MQQYLLSVYQPDGDPPPPEVLEPIMRDARRCSNEEMRGGRRLGVRRRAAPAEHGHGRARVQDGDVLMTDGPYVEGKEHLGGFTIIEAADLDAALDWGRQAGRAPPRCRSRSGPSSARRRP